MTSDARALDIVRVAGPALKASLTAAAKLINDKTLKQQERAQRVIYIAESISQTLKPLTACAKQCSHCCHMATVLSGYEARMIGRYVGREPAKLGREFAADAKTETMLHEKYTGVACPFLVDSKCSVYAVRPIACRLHHNLNDDETNCEILPPDTPGPRPTVPQLNLTPMLLASAFVFLAEDYGDIREFFP